MVALHKTLSGEVPSKGLAFCHRERFLWISISKSLPPLKMLCRMNMEGYMGIQKVNSPSLGRFQSDPYPSHPYLSRLRNWPLIVQLSYLFRSMLSLQVQQTLLLAALLLTKTMMMIIRSPKWEIYHLTLWSQLQENWIGGRGWDSSTCKALIAGWICTISPQPLGHLFCLRVLMYRSRVPGRSVTIDHLQTPVTYRRQLCPNNNVSVKIEAV